MKKYAKITDETTKQCDVGLGTDTEFYESLGMSEMDVEEAWDNSWYLKGYAPKPPAPEELEKENVRNVRNMYLKEYVDPYQLVLRWNSLSTEEQELRTKYRKYLLNYTDNKDWWKQNPLTYDEWVK